jgi:hypothetical protein
MWFLRLLERWMGPRPERDTASYATPLSAGVLALCLTVVYLAMRRVMAVGGTCASGGPYEIATPCPKGVAWMLPLGIIVGMGAALALALTARRGPKLWLLAWPALFLSLGWNFLDFGLDPPDPSGQGNDPGWLVCGVTFALMGGVPLLLLARFGGPRSVLWGATIDETDPLRQAALVRQRWLVVGLCALAVALGIWLGDRIVVAGAS